MTHEQFLTLTEAQRWSLFRVYNRDDTKERQLGMNYIDWLAHCVTNYCGYVGVQWCDMFLGIEPDGYTHS